MNSSIKKRRQITAKFPTPNVLEQKNKIAYKYLSGFSIYTYFFKTIVPRNI